MYFIWLNTHSIAALVMNKCHKPSNKSEINKLVVISTPPFSNPPCYGTSIRGFWFVLGDLYVGSHLFLLEIPLSNKADDDEIN